MSAPFRFLRALLGRDRPAYIHYAVTTKCNLRCRMCEIWKREAKDELGLPEIEELAAVLAEVGCVQISLGGGEPALRDDLPDIVETLMAHGLKVRVLTNGVAMTPSLTDRLLAKGLTEVSFSLDSLDRERQERVDGVSGSFDKRLKNLIYLAEKLPRKGSLPILNTVVTPDNLHELLEIADVAADIGFQASFIPIHLPAADESEHRFFGQASDWRFGKHSEKDLHQVFAGLVERKRRGAPIINSTSFLSESVNYLIDGQATWECRAGELFHSISPQGQVAPCHAFEGLWESDFHELPHLIGSQAFLKDVRKRVADCEGCFRPCWAEISFMMLEGRALREMVRIQARSRFSGRTIDAAAVWRRVEAGASA
ncbi:MAG: radical SAM protein [Acidobacteriota bacterium]